MTVGLTEILEAVRLSRHGGVVEVQLCRPELLNRFDQTLHRELGETLAELADDPDVRVVLLSSTGRYFSAGGDTAIMLEAASDPVTCLRLVDSGRRLFRSFADFPKPLVVALQGDTYGLGATLVLLADAVVTAPQVKFADNHVAMALVAGDGGCVAWPANMGLVKAKRHLLTGDPLSGEEAHRLGIVSDLVPEPADVHPAAMALAQRMAALPPLAVQLTKRALNAHLGADAARVLDLSFYLEAMTFASKDLQEAVEAFHAKRPGVWQGR